MDIKDERVLWPLALVMQEEVLVVDAKANVLAYHDLVVVDRDRAVLATSNIMYFQPSLYELEACPAKSFEKGLVDVPLGSNR